MYIETAMGVSKKTQKQSGFEYAEAVMKWVNVYILLMVGNLNCPT